MKLNPPPRQKVRVHELAAELGWTSRQLLAELCDRGEFVRSAASTLEAPVVRAIRRELAPAVAKPDLDNVYASELYGRSVDAVAKNDPDESFDEALARVKSSSKVSKPGSGQSKWRPPILEALLEEVTAQHGSSPSSRDLKEARYLHRQWAEACLHGLDDNDFTMIKWIRLSGGRRPRLAAELSKAGITPDEAGLQLGYGGRVDTRWPSIFEHCRDRRISRSEAMAAVRQWRENYAAG
jgi:hypothetical protein